MQAGPAALGKPLAIGRGAIEPDAPLPQEALRSDMQIVTVDLPFDVEAERGVPIAQTYIGYMYQNGFGVPSDYVVAASWLNKAAQQGEPTAQFLLGLLFDKGYGVPQDWVQAEVWLNLAASQASGKERDYWARVRDAVAQKLTLDQLAEAQRRAVAWAPIVIRREGPLSARY